VKVPQSTSPKAYLKGVSGILIIGFSVTSICGLLFILNENTAQYDCYVWGFNHMVCRYGQTLEISSGNSRPVKHLTPVAQCEGLAETEKGMSDALRFISGEPVKPPPSDRDYRTFDLQYYTRHLPGDSNKK
jgi:hypothetical protein